LHSGTIPKVYAKLRRAERAALRTSDRNSARKLREALYHVGESLRRWADRELVFLLNQSQSLVPASLSVAGVGLATNEVRLELDCPALEQPRVAVVFEEHAGWLMARIAEPGWLAKISPDEWQPVVIALAGLYQMAGVKLVREQIAASLGDTALTWAIAEPGLVLRDGSETVAVYDLGERPVLRPRPAAGFPLEGLPELEADRVIFGNVAITWRQWVGSWGQGSEKAELPRTLEEGMRRLAGKPLAVLPAPG
jgi:hypothetical protein